MVENLYQSRLPGRSAGTLGRLAGLGPGEADRGEKALWLSGGGYRAALFHLGALTRLNELGLLGQIDTVGAVAGGSIMAALVATRVSWPLRGAYRDWPEQVAEPMRAIARRNARARAFLRKPLASPGADAALEERYARELLDSLGGEPERGPRFVFGAAGLTLAGLVHAQANRVEWDLAAAQAPGYAPELVSDVIAAVRTDLDAFGVAEQAVLENHGYLLADAAARRRGLTRRRGIETAPPQPPHPRWRRARGASRSGGCGRGGPSAAPAVPNRARPSWWRCWSATGRCSSTTRWRASGPTRSRRSASSPRRGGATPCTAPTAP